ncbi:MAG TPA: hypothetical protein VMF06_19350 [Candidatus Limnocylindria bacterium]|jgi:hypothetical protein|nr:hypothetical protein [Candidatus Limnocylindria bacterium]
MDRLFENLVMGVLAFLALYFLFGAIFGVFFHWRGIHRIDAGVAGSGILFRVLITPGIMAFWPWLAIRWQRAAAGLELAIDPEHTVSQKGLRRLHGLAWKALAVAIPLTVGVALWTRAKPLPDQPLPGKFSQSIAPVSH